MRSNKVGNRAEAEKLRLFEYNKILTTSASETGYGQDTLCQLIMLKPRYFKVLESCFNEGEE